MQFHDVLNLSVPANGRPITGLEFTRLTIRGIGVRRKTLVHVRRDGRLFVLDTAGREHDVGRCAQRA